MNNLVQKILNIQKYFRYNPTLLITGAATNQVQIEMDVLCGLIGENFFKEYRSHFNDSIFEINSKYTSLIKCSVKTCLKLRLHHSAKLTFIVSTGPSIRHKLTKSILFSHQ